MRKKIFIALEAAAVIALAAVAVVYAQVLWQRLMSDQGVPATVNETGAETANDANPGELTEAERMRILNDLSQSGEPSLSEEERSQVLESLSESSSTAPTLSEAERLEILKSLE